jgi:glycosyltransferase involved in cell wall biosynthesis
MTDRPLRFCMVTTFYPPCNFRGDGVFVHRLANALAEDGHQVDVIHCLDAYRLLASGPPTTEPHDHPNVTVHGLKSPLGPVSPLATHQTGRPFLKAGAIRRILARGFDVIHYHNVSLIGGPGAFALGRGLKLYSMHDYWTVCPMHALFQFNRAACDRPRCLRCSLAYGRPPQWWRFSRLLRRSLRHLDALIAPSRFAVRKHRERGLDLPVEHIPHFVPEPAADAVDPHDVDRPYFLFVGRLEKLKGLQTLLPLFKPYPRATLVAAGAGSYETALRRLAGGSDRVRFAGHLGDAELHRLYRGARALIVPSLCFETTALVILEAFSRGTPVLVRDIGAMPEVVHQSGAGFVYRTDDELRSAMDRLLDQPGLRAELGRRARSAWRRHWTPRAHLDRYLGLVRRLLQAEPHA